MSLCTLQAKFQGNCHPPDLRGVAAGVEEKKGRSRLPHLYTTLVKVEEADGRDVYCRQLFANLHGQLLEWSGFVEETEEHYMCCPA